MKYPLLLLLFLTSLPLFAQWDQEHIELNDPVYEEIEFLYRQQGEALPSAVKPWTRSEARAMMDRLELKNDYSERIYSSLETQNVLVYEEESLRAAIPLKGGLDLQAWWILHESGEDLEDYPFTRTARQRGNFLEVPFTFSLLKDQLYLEMNLNFREDLNTDWENPHNITNLPLSYYDLDMTFPQRAYGSFGGEHWNFFTGRTLQNWGSARTGNMVLSDTAQFHELLRFKTFFSKFNYTWAMLSIDPRLSNPQEDFYKTFIVTDPDTGEGYYPNLRHLDPDDIAGNNYSGEKYLLLHNFEFRPHKSLRIGLTEGLLLGGADFNLSPTFFNPMLLFHNWFTNNALQGNGVHMLEADWVVGKQLIYGQICLDQFQSSSETESFEYAANEPNAFGWLLGINRMQPFLEGYLSLNLETVWTMPYLYTSSGYYTAHSINEYHPSSTSFYKTWPLGYPEGNDALTFSLMGRYRIPGDWYLDARADLIFNGQLDVEDPFPSNTTDPSLAKQFFPSSPVNTKFIFTLDGGKQLNEHLSIEAGNHLIYQENPDPLFTENGGVRYDTIFWAVEPWFSLAWSL